MQVLSDALSADGWAFVLVLARVLPLCWLLATLTDELVPRPVALSLALALAAGLLPTAGSVELAPDLPALLLGLARALCIGGVFAFAGALALLAIPWSVRLAHERAGLAPVAPFARLYAWCASLLVLSLGGLRALLIALAESFQDAPLSSRGLSTRAFGLGMAQLLADAFAAALGFGMPLLLSVWLLETGGALVARVLGPLAPAPPSLRPLWFFAAAALLLVPIASFAPEGVRAAIVGARALTRAFAR